ncbi:MAG: hypothetical protein JW904_07355 [Spirochaetales bacterium]|nr:hypothetical protein [Spirochaetales bacterium]
MKKSRTIISVIFLGLAVSLFAGCITLKDDKLPPGQEKKIEDEKNARDFAPGYNK